MKTPSLFKFNNYSLRVITDDNNQPWFIAVDVCNQLDLRNVSQALTRLDDNEKSAIISNDVTGRPQEMWFISESGFYSIVLSSKKQEAKDFKKWVTSEVLPSIREYGLYSLPKSMPTHAEALRLYADSLDKIREKDKLIVATNQAQIAAGEILVREFCKSNDIVDLGEHQFWHWMRDNGIVSESNEPYQKFVKQGYFTWKPTEEMHGGKFRYSMRITPRGKVWLASKYMAYLDAQ